MRERHQRRPCTCTSVVRTNPQLAVYAQCFGQVLGSLGGGECAVKCAGAGTARIMHGSVAGSRGRCGAAEQVYDRVRGCSIAQ
jgi:hypothetical protein